MNNKIANKKQIFHMSFIKNMYVLDIYNIPLITYMHISPHNVTSHIMRPKNVIYNQYQRLFL